ncbi:hypothetical protein CRG98_019877 [Punica granatum]|uniref:Uncharacterized protein n=1 Tax=Punica granatum TaxID=22663 RepID=A0A2I0JTV1_PUNGR|nr:hypothetical protein CRG98_019877 [Punica granatum]
MQGQNPKAVNAGPEPDVGLEPDVVNAGPEPDAGLKPDAGPKPDVVNAGPKPKSGAEARCGAEALCEHTERRASIHTGDVLTVDRPSGHSSSCRRGRVKTASGLPAVVGTTRLSCGVGGRAGRPLVIARLAMER